MEAPFLILAATIATVLAAGGDYLFWRYYWFWRNPPGPPRPASTSSARPTAPSSTSSVPPDEPVIVCKQGKAATINDIVREQLSVPKIIIGIFMSPFGVHYNRAPFTAAVAYKKQYPAEGKNVHMGSMHWRSLLHRLPIYANSPHILQNNRAVTRFCGPFRGQEISCYVVQIGGGSVHGIDVYRHVGEHVEKGEVFGMIRVGSQVDLIVPDLPGLEVKVSPGDRVVAGETILIG